MGKNISPIRLIQKPCFDANKTAARIGGRIAGDARIQLEKESGKPVISKENYLDLASIKPNEIDKSIEN